MYWLLYDPFGEHCMVKIAPISKETALANPFVNQCVCLMSHLAEADIKISKAGYMPPKIVEEMYRLGASDWWIDEHVKRITEPKCETVQAARIVLKLAGLIKERKGVMSLTAEGRKQLPQVEKVAHSVLDAILNKFNKGYFDIFKDSQCGNAGVAYAVWLVHHFGDQWHDFDFYTQKPLTSGGRYAILSLLRQRCSCCQRATSCGLK